MEPITPSPTISTVISLVDAESGQSVTDATLIRRSLTRPEAFADVYRRHAPVIRRYAARRLGRDAAEDVVSETFLAAFKQRDRYRSSFDDARPWLLGIANNLIARRRSHELRQLRLLAKTGIDPVVASFAEEVEQRVSSTAVNRRLAAALARLPSAQREALLLVAWGELSYPEAAAALGIPVGTVRSQISRARKRLAGALADLADTETEDPR